MKLLHLTIWNKMKLQNVTIARLSKVYDNIVILVNYVPSHVINFIEHTFKVVEWRDP